MSDTTQRHAELPLESQVAPADREAKEQISGPSKFSIARASSSGPLTPASPKSANAVASGKCRQTSAQLAGRGCRKLAKRLYEKGMQPFDKTSVAPLLRAWPGKRGQRG